MSDLATERYAVLAPWRRTRLSAVDETTVATCFLPPKTGAAIRTRDPTSTRTGSRADAWHIAGTGVISANAHSADMTRIASPVLEAPEGEAAFACGTCSGNNGISELAG
jgi:hypothetical protein